MPRTCSHWRCRRRSRSAPAGLAEVRALQGRHADAVALLQQYCDAAPHPENFYLLGRGLERAGRHCDAAAAYREFERRALAEADGEDNANRQLIRYDTERGARPDEALRLARRKLERRQDVFTRAAYAWALHAAGRSV